MSSPATNGASVRVVTSIHRYPIKSCRGESLREALVGVRGIVGDREYMVVDANGDFLTQREIPRMALVVPQLLAGGVRLAAAGTPSLDVPCVSAPLRQVKVWSDTCRAADQGDDAARWFSDFLQHECRLVHFPTGEHRRADKEFSVVDDEVGFSDGFPFLLANEQSLADLNARMEIPLPMNRFRPNIVIDGHAPFEEDGWKHIRIGEIGFRTPKPCARCPITTTNQETAEVLKEPLRTLATFRHVRGKGVMFGHNMLHDASGTLRVGDPVLILS